MNTRRSSCLLLLAAGLAYAADPDEFFESKVRPVFTRSERLKSLVDRAYREKYNTPGSLHYVRGFKEKKRRDTTTELVPNE